MPLEKIYKNDPRLAERDMTTEELMEYLYKENKAGEKIIDRLTTLNEKKDNRINSLESELKSIKSKWYYEKGREIDEKIESFKAACKNSVLKVLQAVVDWLKT